MKTRIAFFLFSFACFNLSAQTIEYHPCMIEYNNGDIIKGLVRTFYCSDQKIHFKKDEESKKQKLKSKDLHSITMYVEEDSLIFHKYDLGRYNARCSRIRKFDGHCWASLIYESDNIQAFQYLSKYTIKSKVNLQEIIVSTIAATIAAGAANGGNYFYVYAHESLTFGLRFPGVDPIIDLISDNDGPESLNTRRFKKRICKYMSKHCKKFREYLRADPIQPEYFFDYLELYSEKCK